MPNLIRQFLSFLLYPIGMAAVGFAVGWTVGLSNTPVVAAMLPVALGLAAAGGGLWIGRVDLSEPVDRGRFAVLGASLLLFAAAAVQGTRSGMAERAERDARVEVAVAEPASTEPTALAEPAVSGPTLVEFPLSDDPARAIDALVLRRQLASIGASVDEQRHVLMALALEQLEAPTAARALVDLRAELAIDRAIVRAGLDASSREGPLADGAAWERASARLEGLTGVDIDPAQLADERLAVLQELEGNLEGDPMDGGPALRAARGALATRSTLARADALSLGGTPALELANRRARADLAELVGALAVEAERAPAPVTIIERTVPAPAAPAAEAPTAFGRYPAGG
ncbi:hypothetical protein [Engelhardtia mirabilis]|uniref:Uncharacterized protein n=1 Tax=Engelhardtia mirabilis TaxID=2528011 RepID=A0A518BT00_9BACT|nr:hypothetical protein Pla133_52230 [Planctomycetes bacterium Pla133]QDV04425.1 hypothetical protein Pla86_52200 [Planctomycetes bacterium Pla86]